MSKKNDTTSSTNARESKNDKEIHKEKTSRRGFLAKSTKIIGGLLVLPVAQSAGGEERIRDFDKPAAASNPERSLILQIPEEVRNAELMISNLEVSAALRTQFVTQPAAVLREFAIISSQDTTTSVSDVNRLFLSVVSNRNLMEWVGRQMPVSAPPPAIQAVFRKWAEARSALLLPSEYISGVVTEIARNETFLREFLGRLAQDSAVSAMLPAGIGEQELTAVATAGLREMANDAIAGRLPVMSTANRQGIFVVAGNSQRLAIFVVIPAIAIAVIIALVVIHLGCWVTGPTPASFTAKNSRQGILDLSRQLIELQTFDLPPR